MLRVRRDQILTLQAAMDGPLIEHYVDDLREQAATASIEEDELRELVGRGVTTARQLDAPQGQEMTFVVLLSVFFRPDFAELPEVKALLGQPNMSLAAKLRILMTTAFHGPEPEDL